MCSKYGEFDYAINPQKAKKFASQAKSLEQIANFHNTIGDRMITSQRPMMLDAAVGLAKLVKDQTNMTWDNTQQVSPVVIFLHFCVLNEKVHLVCGLNIKLICNRCKLT